MNDPLEFLSYRSSDSVCCSGFAFDSTRQRNEFDFSQRLVRVLISEGREKSNLYSLHIAVTLNIKDHLTILQSAYDNVFLWWEKYHVLPLFLGYCLDNYIFRMRADKYGKTGKIASSTNGANKFV